LVIPLLQPQYPSLSQLFSGKRTSRSLTWTPSDTSHLRKTPRDARYTKDATPLAPSGLYRQNNRK
jgi:hypothetical protein